MPIAVHGRGRGRLDKSASCPPSPPGRFSDMAGGDGTFRYIPPRSLDGKVVGGLALNCRSYSRACGVTDCRLGMPPPRFIRIYGQHHQIGTLSTLTNKENLTDI